MRAFAFEAEIVERTLTDDDDV